MKLKLWHSRVRLRLSHRNQLANFTKQVVTNPGQQPLAGPLQICRGLVGSLIRQDPVFFGRKRNGIAVNWDAIPLVREDATFSSLGANLNLPFIVKPHLSAGIKKSNSSRCVDRFLCGTQNNFISPIPSAKLPRSLEKLKELAHHIAFRRIRNHPYQ